ncbi:ABC transporter ATP-binding protein [Sphingopyxis sp.]|jgi:branched-chain amino acid transport system ATP-binding protein|uniref:ABC transporter ATP-binding protein n=1 Tax=Sphingopyxis sp. TaxID=1908224 RepID=UPI002DEACDDE|nr:ABC transporter ATP-binding protein [Sphingopyxis sp.]
MKPLLEVRGLSAGYGQIDVLRGLDFTVGEGEVLALLGANGAGKTSCLRALSGISRRDGEIRFDGVRIDRAAPEAIARLGIAHVPDDRGTFASLSVDENLALGAMARANDASINADRERCLDLFPRLRERRAQQAGTLSGGEQQMLAIARALMMRPRLILLDEPSFGVAPIIVRQIFDVLAEIRRSGTAMLLVEQNTALALELTDRACLLESGEIILSGSADEIGSNDGVRAAYLGH